MTPTAQQSVIAACSFCAKPNTEVATLIAGPGVYICNQCVALSQQVIEAKAEAVPRLAPWQQIDDVEAVLANLPRIAKAGEQVEASLTGWVRRGPGAGSNLGSHRGSTRHDPPVGLGAILR